MPNQPNSSNSPLGLIIAIIVGFALIIFGLLAAVFNLIPWRPGI